MGSTVGIGTALSSNERVNDKSTCTIMNGQPETALVPHATQKLCSPGSKRTFGVA